MPSIRRASVPLASLTAVGMLATDLYLPAVPSLPQQLGGTVVHAQATLAVFIAALAISQLLWGWASDRFGETRVILMGTLLLGGASIVCALSPDVVVLLAARVVQGLGAGAATVVVPVLLRKKFSERDAVRSLSIVAMAESVIPALGPVAGTLVIAYTDWRMTFWIVSALTLALVPAISTIVGMGGQPIPLARTSSSSFMPVLRNRVFVRYALSYALMFGALVMFVASAPQIVTGWLNEPVSSFAVLQIFGVTAFMLGATGGGKLVQRGRTRLLMTAGVLMQAVSCTTFVGLAAADMRSFGGVTAGWALFCAGLGMRGPLTMTRALSVAHELAGKASGVLMFLAFAISALATILVAPLLHGFLPLAIGLSLMTLTSVLTFLRMRK
jgi:MFS family permease